VISGKGTPSYVEVMLLCPHLPFLLSEPPESGEEQWETDKHKYEALYRDATAWRCMHELTKDLLRGAETCSGGDHLKCAKEIRERGERRKM
jgi:hypothetical protein